MAQRLRACRSVLLLGVFLTASYGYGEEPRNHTAAVKVQERAALEASIPRREVELALRDEEEVLAEVKRRIQDLRLNASAEQLTGLLEKRAHLEIAIDKCRLAGVPGDSCRGDEAAMAELEASFRQKTGISTREFRSGRRDTPGRDAERAGVAGRRAGKAAGDTCTCAFSVYSQDRWINRYWGLECNNHSSHGVCSNDVDSAHTAGIGAMTGDVDLYFGPHHANRDCPDDHVTCFKGPSTDNEWGNVCNCDTWHSQSYNPSIAWYGGDLTDSALVYQLSTGYLSVAGACNEVSVSVREFIKENDPWCCDDPMGDLWVGLPLGNGYGTTSGPTSAQNCNGGSQSGAYPYCGTFGATIRVDYACSTYSPPPPPECDTELEQTCYGRNETWNPETCQCETCQPPPNCPYWDEQSCLCYAF